jgi:hypothetical protein
MDALEDYAERYFYDEGKDRGNISQATKYLVCMGLRSLGFSVSSEKIPLPSYLPSVRTPFSKPEATRTERNQPP